jgi:dimethylargininase
MQIAITRAVSRTLSRCELSFLERKPIDVALARQQHRAYEYALEAAGCRLIALPAEDDSPDAVFVEDVAVVLDEIAIRTRPGAVSRREEVASVAKALGAFRRLGAIESPGTLDGGDVLRAGRVLYVGQSARTNAAGIEQLRSLVSGNTIGGQGYDVQAVPVRGCLHLKAAVTEVSEGTLLINPAWVEDASFAHLRRIVVDPSEPHAANALRVGSGVIFPACFPRTLRRLADAGIKVTSVDVSELQKAEGAVTCCSLVFDAATNA